jgi:hypothetical protein
MKNIFQFLFSLIVLIGYHNTVAQSPQKMSYQSVVRDASGMLVANLPIGIKISILEGSLSGTEVFSETHLLTTNANGLVSVEIGGGMQLNGSFTNINWSNGSHFIKTEIDPNGGVNYTITGTSQLLSVPYAMYAENTKPMGKSTILLTGDITDAQAQAKLARELGPYTENISVLNTTVLTSLDLTGIKELYKLEIRSNAGLTSIIANELEVVNGDIGISLNPGLTAINLPALRTCLGKFFENSNFNVTALDLTSLANVGNDFSINANVTNVYLPALKTVAGNLKITGFPTTSVDLPQVEKVYGLLLQGLSELTSLNVPSLVDCFQLEITGTKLLSLNLPNLLYSSIKIQYNTLLTAVLIPNLSPQGGNYSNFYFDQNNLPSAQVNYLLSRLGSFPGNHKQIKLMQLPPAPPTGQGIIDKATLISQGHSVYTD